MSDALSGVSILSADSATKLVADMQYMEPYASTALNRKLKNILKPGIYSGFKPVPGTGLNVVITSDAENSEGAASIDVNDVQITINQIGDVTVPVSAGATTIIALEANYKFGVKTTQVDSTSTVAASQIIALVGTTTSDNQLELCRVKVPLGATEITEAMIILTTRIEREVGVVFSSAIDSEEEKIAATPLAVKLVVERSLGKRNNLSDLSDVEEARENLQLGSAALKDTGTSGEAVPLLNAKNTWAENQSFDKGAKVTGTLSITGDNTATGVVSGNVLQSESVLFVSGEVDYLPEVQGAYVGWNRTVGGGRLDLICHKGAGAGGVDIWSGNSVTQKLIGTARDGLLVGISPDSGSGTAGVDNYGPMVASCIKGRGADRSAIDTGAVFGVRLKETVGSQHLGLFCLEGFSIAKYWEMRSNGEFYSGGRIIAADEVQAGGGASRMSSSGNIYGTQWGGWLADWINRTFVTGIRLGSASSAIAWNGPGWNETAGFVVTATINGNQDGYIDSVYARPLQYCIGGTWYTAASL